MTYTPVGSGDTVPTHSRQKTRVHGDQGVVITRKCVSPLVGGTPGPPRIRSISTGLIPRLLGVTDRVTDRDFVNNLLTYSLTDWSPGPSFRTTRPVEDPPKSLPLSCLSLTLSVSFRRSRLLTEPSLCLTPDTKTPLWGDYGPVGP